MLRVIRRLAIVSLAVAVLFDIAVYLGLAAALNPSTFAYFTALNFVHSTTQLLCFATGTLALVPAAQQRRRAWFVMLLVSLIIASYGPMAIQLYWLSGYQPSSLSSSAEVTAAIIFPFAIYI